MTQRKYTVAMVAFSAALGLTTFSCGGGSGSCGKVEPCGGDVVGNYNVSAAGLVRFQQAFSIGLCGHGR